MIPKGLPPNLPTSAGAAAPSGPALSPGTAAGPSTPAADAFTSPVDPSAAAKLSGGKPPLIARAELDARSLAGVAQSNPGLAAKQFRGLLERNPEPEYRHTLTSEVASRTPELLEEAVKDELAELNKIEEHERQGALNAVGDFVLDAAANLGFGKHTGAELDEDIASANATYAELEKKSHLDAAGAEQLQELFDKAKKDARDYDALKSGVARTVGSVGATLASIAVGPRAGLLTGGLMAAVGEVGAKALIDGKDYNLDMAGRDAVVGFVSGAATAKVRSLNLGNALARNFHVRGFGSFLVSGAADGALLGAVNGAALGSVDPKVWNQGVGPGLLAIAQRAGMGVAVGAATGGTVGAAARLFSRSTGAAAGAVEGGTRAAARHASEMEPALVVARNQGFSLLSTLEQQKITALLQGSTAARDAVSQIGTQASGQTPAQQAEQLRALLPST